MVRRKIGTTLASCGIVMMLLGLSALPALGARPAPVALQPSPRPPLEQPTRQSSSGDGTIVEMGHITGTVIDLTVGAPIPGVAVQVGGDTVLSDQNGNYDHWLPVGTYTVTLALEAGQGAPEQGPLAVVVQPQVATLQHLNFRSLAAATVAPTVAPVATPQAAPRKPAGASGAPPNRLPRTGSEGSAVWLWLAFGLMLLLAGGMVGFGPVLSGRSPATLLRAYATDLRLLRGLLATPAQPADRPQMRPQPVQDDFLAALLDQHAGPPDRAP